MHPAQKAIFELAQTTDVGKMKLRELGAVIGVTHPQTVKYHLDTLIKNGALIKGASGSIRVVDPNEEKGGLIRIPVLGEANCGEALVFAEGGIKGYLPVSASVLNLRSFDGLFAVIAVGDSMNNANIAGQPINDGDFVIAKKNNPFDYKNGDYIVASFGGVANIKKMVLYEEERYIALVSESLSSLPPIYVSTEDLEQLQVHGKVIKVLENPR